MQNPDSDLAQKKDEAERLRAAEKFMKVGTGEAFCRGCGYEYKPSKGDPEYPISAGTYFTVLLFPPHPLATPHHMPTCKTQYFSLPKVLLVNLLHYSSIRCVFG